MISAGICFTCNGKGYKLTTEKAIKQSEKQKEKRKQEKEAKAKIIREYNETKFKYFLELFKNDSDFINRMKGLDPEEKGYQLAFNIMQIFEVQGKFSYDIPEPF